MEHLIVKCPICRVLLSNPEKLREHRLKEHKSPYSLIPATT
ncbi:MAG: hypothetical protein ACM3UY_08570 [Methanocella sp.]|jgi:phage FluMu protein Com